MKKEFKDLVPSVLIIQQFSQVVQVEVGIF